MFYTAYNEPIYERLTMSYRDYLDKSNAAVQQSREASTPQQKENAYNAFFDAAIDFFNETCTGDMTLADGSTVFIPAIQN